jgi:arylsulfatase A-like enzyme
MTSQPNVLVIHTDQQSSWTLSCYGGTLVDTPNVDRLAREGAVFDQFFTNSAVCTPSRGCFVTGRYPHSHGAYTNNIPLNRDEITFAEQLRRNGYHTGYTGKWHLDGTPRPGWVHPERTMGFTDAYYMFNRGHWSKIEDARMGTCEPTVFPYDVYGDEKTYTTDWLTDKTIAFLEKRHERPFCFMVSIPDPHGPFRARPPYDTMYSPDDMPLPETFTDQAIPAWAAAVRDKGAYSLDNQERENALRRNKAHYCGAVKLIDDSVGRMLSCLEEKGILDETLVIFTTDHGDYMGEHGLHSKNNLYETAYRIPLVMRLPERVAAGARVSNIVSTVDFQPTLLGILGVETCGREQGNDASALLRNDTCEWADESFLYHSSQERAGIFTPEYELALVKDGQSILFDRKNDPQQLKNLFESEDARALRAELLRRLVDHHVEMKSPEARWLVTEQRRIWQMAYSG